MLFAVMEADRSVYTARVVNRLQNEEKVINADEHFMDKKALPLPAQMFRFGAERVGEKTKDLLLLAAVALADQQAERSRARTAEKEGLEVRSPRTRPSPSTRKRRSAGRSTSPPSMPTSRSRPPA